MSRYECWSLSVQMAVFLAQVGTLVILALTLRAVAIYARDTEKIKEAAVE